MTMHYSSWEDYLEKTKEPENEDQWEKSFLVYAKSYWLEGYSILKAVLQDDNGEEQVSQLDLNNYIGVDADENKYGKFIMSYKGARNSDTLFFYVLLYISSLFNTCSHTFSRQCLVYKRLRTSDP